MPSRRRNFLKVTSKSILYKYEKTFFYIRNLFILIWLSTCSSEPDLFFPLVKKEDKKNYATLIDLAQEAFDKGDADTVILYGEEALKQESQSEKLAYLLAYSYLTKAGLDTNIIINKMKEPTDESNNQNSSSSSFFEKILTLEKKEYNFLGTLETDDPDLPLVVPFCAKRARNSLGRLILIQKAIDILCPLVDPELKVSKEGRHLCPLISSEKKYQSEIQIAWMLAHLTESVIFYAVLHYKSSATNKNTNLELRVDKLKEYDMNDPEQISLFLTNMNSINISVDAIFPTGFVCSATMPDSQFMATVKDLDTINKSLTSMSYLPKSWTNNLAKSLKSISETTSSKDELLDLKSKVESVKNDTTQSIISILNDKLGEINPENISNEKKTEICLSYKNITKDNPQTTKPQLCQD